MENYSRTEFIRNPFLKNIKDDDLFHLDLSQSRHNLKAMFGDIKFICMSGTVRRIKEFAGRVAKELGIKDNSDSRDLAACGNRYCMFKVGPVLCVNHGLGFPSVMIMLVEVIKLLYYAGVKDPIILRIGTSGGLNVPCGTVVIINEVVNEYFESNARIPVLGKLTLRPAVVDQEIANELKSIAEKIVDFSSITGKTMCQEHLYETFAMKNNLICEVTDEERNQFFEKIKENKITNFDMESLMIFSMSHNLGIKAGCITVVVNDICKIMNRPTEEELFEWESRPQKVALEFIKKKLKKSNN